MTEIDNHNGHPDQQLEVASRRLQEGIMLVVGGEIDLATAPPLEYELLRAAASHDLVALDLSSTSFMDSTGLHMILTANNRLRERGGRLLIVQAPAQIRRLFELTGVTDHLELVDDAAALEAPIC